MVFVAGTAVNVPVHKRLLFYIQLSKAVDQDMNMDIAALVMSVIVRADYCLMPWETPGCKFHAQLLCSFRCQSAFCLVLRVETQNIMMGITRLKSITTCLNLFWDTGKQS
jgi:hypothetical protein